MNTAGHNDDDDDGGGIVESALKVFKSVFEWKDASMRLCISEIDVKLCRDRHLGHITDSLFAYSANANSHVLLKYNSI